MRALVLILLGLTVTIGSATSDAYLHRGASDGAGEMVRQPTGRALATNADLRPLPPEARAHSLDLLAGAGYEFIRQEISWAQSQPETDRFDWSVSQEAIGAITERGLTPVVVLVDTPRWARAPDDVGWPDAPAFSPELFETWCAALRAQFPMVQIFQVMGNLDDPAFWGGEQFSSNTYRQLLAAAARGLDIAATDSTLVAGEVGLNPESRRSGADIDVLEEMATSPEIRGLVDVFAVAVDGGVSSPYDRRAEVASVNLSRVVLMREALDEAGAEEAPIWFTHFGWTGDGESLISPEAQAQLVQSGIRRARSEWAWAGLIFNWQLTVDGGSGGSQMGLINGGLATPLLSAMADYGTSSLGRSVTTGFVPPDSPACAYAGNWQDQFLAGALYRTVRDPAAMVTCRFYGTGLAAVLRFGPDAGTARFIVDEEGEEAAEAESVILRFGVDDAFELPVELAAGLPEGEHTVSIQLEAAGELVIGGFIVSRERPMIWPIAVLVTAGLVALFLGLRSLAYLAAGHVGLIDQRPETPESTPLPVMPDWRPDPRLGRR